MTKITIPDTVIEVVADFEVVAAPVEMKAQCQLEVCRQAEQFIDKREQFQSICDTFSNENNVIFSLHEKMAATDAEKHQDVGNPHQAPFVEHTDDGKLELKVVQVALAMVVEVADEEFQVSVVAVASGWQYLAFEVVEVEVAVKKNKEEVKGYWEAVMVAEETQGAFGK